MKTYVQCLMLYKLEEDELQIIEEQELKEDKAVIFGEIVDVLKAILFITLTKMHQRMGPKKKGKIAEQINLNMSLDDALKNIEDEIAGKNDKKSKGNDEDEDDKEEQEEIIEGYTINKEVIIQAWAVYRPKIEDPDPDAEEEKDEEQKSNSNNSKKLQK